MPRHPLEVRAAGQGLHRVDPRGQAPLQAGRGQGLAQMGEVDQIPQVAEAEEPGDQVDVVCARRGFKS